MRKVTLTTILLFALTCGVTAADFSLRIVAYPKVLPKGAPVYVVAEARNKTGHPLTGVGFSEIQFRVTNKSGGKQNECYPGLIIDGVPRCNKVVIPSDWYQLTALEKRCFPDLDEWSIQAYILGRGECTSKDAQGNVVGSLQGWKGEVDSEEIRIQIVEPSGQDMEVYKATRGKPMANPKELIEKYPTSTYTAYAIVDRDKGFLPTAFDLQPEMLAMEKKLAISTINPSEVKGEHSYGRGDVAKVVDKITSYQALLAVHPDFPLRYAFDYWLAMSYYAVHDFKNARLFLNKCTTQENPEPIQAVAKIYLDVLDEKGIK